MKFEFLKNKHFKTFMIFPMVFSMFFMGYLVGAGFLAMKADLNISPELQSDLFFDYSVMFWVCLVSAVISGFFNKLTFKVEESKEITKKDIFIVVIAEVIALIIAYLFLNVIAFRAFGFTFGPTFLK